MLKFPIKMPWPGFEPGSSRPQREVLTPILSRPGDAGYRSRYLSHAKRALYHLSYTPWYVRREQIKNQLFFLIRPNMGIREMLALGSVQPSLLPAKLCPGEVITRWRTNTFSKPTVTVYKLTRSYKAEMYLTGWPKNHHLLLIQVSLSF